MLRGTKMLGLPCQAAESPEHSEDDRQLSIAELQGDPLHYVMAHLDIKSLCSAVQVGALVLNWWLYIFFTHTCLTLLCPAGLQTLASCRFAKTCFLRAPQCVKRLPDLIVLPTGGDDILWQKLASRLWPPSTLRLRPYYQTCQVF